MLLFEPIKLGGRGASKLLSRWISLSATWLDNKISPTQLESLKEMCFQVDDNDKVIGTLTKKEAHKVDEQGNVPLHRAFSVFLFNSSGLLLLQKRSEDKITYPGHYTNSCCSHPIADFPGEEEEKDALGIKKAAKRRLNYELGIPLDEIDIDKFTYLTRIHYLDPGNGMFGEHEIDYILFMQANVSLTPNPDEISEISFVGRDDIKEFLPSLEAPLTPWFKLILKYRLSLWWENLDKLETLTNHKDVEKLTGPSKVN